MTGADVHDLDVTVWVGKAGVEPVAAELADQLAEREQVKVRFLRAAVGGSDVETVAAELADLADAELLETRGNTGVYR